MISFPALIIFFSMVKIEHILEKGSGSVNEDQLVIGETIFGVFDGATSLEKPVHLQDENHAVPSCLPPEQTGGRLAATIAKNTFAANHHPLDVLGHAANTAILGKMKASGVCLDRPGQVWSTSAAVVRIKDNGLEWFQTGDSHILLIYEDGSHKVLVQRDDHDFETLVMLKAAKDKTMDNPVLRHQVLKVRAGMNRHYGVLNGDPRAMAFTAGGQVSMDGVAAALLFTDGLSLPTPVPQRKKSFSDLAQNFQTLGLKGLHKKIRALEDQDPDRKMFPRFKCHDDIAAIALHFK